MKKLLERLRQAVAFAGLLNKRFDAAQGTEKVHESIAGREKHFLALVRELFSGSEDSPYRFLFGRAGIDEPEVIRLLGTLGLETTLGQLFDRGVYLSLPELKGRVPIRRAGAELSVKPGAFRRTLPQGIQTRSGGSRSAGTAVNAPMKAIENGLLGLAAYDQFSTGPNEASLTWLPGPPTISGLFSVLRGLNQGAKLNRWFTPVPTPEAAQKSARALLLAFTIPSKLLGIPFPRMATVPISSVKRVLEEIQFLLTKAPGVFITTYPSLAVRIAQCALDSKVLLSAVTFYVTGEPLTDRRAEIIRSSGAAFVDTYGSTEVGFVARSCLAPGPQRSLHVLTHSVGLILRTKDDPRRSQAVNALYATPLEPSLGMALLNVEMGDSADMQIRSCGCPLEAFGLTTHLSGLWSYEKLTGEGMTFEAETFIPIIEEAFPQHFGGATSEYQLVEEMDPSGLSKLLLIVPERFTGVTDKEFLDYFWARFRAQDGSGVKALAADIWTRADTIQVRRREPYRTFAGKCLPFHLHRA